MPKKPRKELKKQEESSDPEESNRVCDLCFEEKELSFDEETTMMICADCSTELEEERALTQAIYERPIEYYDRERYDNDED